MRASPLAGGDARPARTRPRTRPHTARMATMDVESEGSTMDLPVSAHDIEQAEAYLAAGDLETAQAVLEELVGEVRDWASEECAVTDEVQWFAFEDAFERLAYRRVERDPRRLVQVSAPLGRLYAALAFVYIRQQDWPSARDALKQAVRWNPMNCDYRLDLAEVFRALGNVKEWASLSFSVVERASDALSAARAYANLGQLFADEGEFAASLGCLRAALRLDKDDARVVRLAERLGTELPADVSGLTDEQVATALEGQGVPAQPNAEIAICLLMCASDAAREGDAAQAARFTVRARDLVGDAAAKALIQLIHESDAELAEERADATSASSEEA